MQYFDTLTSTDTLIIFTSSPTGLGHIRVMDALRDGLPDSAKVEEIGIVDINAAKIHALGSRIPILKNLTEFYQTNPVAESISTYLYKTYLHNKTVVLTKKLKEVRLKHPWIKNWIVVSTHYAFAHSIEVVKRGFKKRFGIKITLCVVMTDDSPQRVWAVKGANLIFSPSEKTTTAIKKLLGEHFKTKVATVSFPISPRLTQKLDDMQFRKVHEQLDPIAKTPLHIEIPISGAAVQLNFMRNLIESMRGENYIFTVTGQESIYTQRFFDKLRSNPKVQLMVGTSAKQTVNFYESLFYQTARPAIEITKPSEQVFKAILKPNERGGVILLLTEPIGRQEKDNLNFLIRHDLMPDEKLQNDLYSLLLSTNHSLPNPSSWHYRASHWRAIRLPKNPDEAALFIKRLKETGILLAMLSYVSANKPELTSNGVKQIWEEISKFLV